MSKRLMEDKKLMVFSPALAQVIGLNGAIVLQQLHYWLTMSNHEIDGRKWVYNSYVEWNKQFPFWSLSMVKRVFRSLEGEGFLLSGKFNNSRMDQTKWYTIDYYKLEQLGVGNVAGLFAEETNSTHTSEQPETMNDSHQTEQGDFLNKPIPKITTKDYYKEYYKKIFIYKQVIDNFNAKNNSGFCVNNRETMAVIWTKCREGYRLSHFQQVDEWKKDLLMSIYVHLKHRSVLSLIRMCNRKLGSSSYERRILIFVTKRELYSFLPFRDNYYHRDAEDTNKMVVIGVKQRKRPIGTITLKFQKESGTFTEKNEKGMRKCTSLFLGA